MIHRHYFKQHTRLIAQLRTARIRQDVSLQKKCVRRYFGAPAARYVIADRVIDFLPGEGREQRVARVEALARRVNPFAPCLETVRWWRQAKRSCGVRAVCDLSPALRVRHYMIREVLSILFRPHGHIFDRRGGGRDRLAISIAAAMDEGLTHALVGDIRDCFPSVDARALYRLPLPKQVIRYALDYRNLHFRHDVERERAERLPVYHGDPSRGRNGPSGLLQGSPAANLILAWFLNDMDEHLSSSCRLFLLSDNVIVLARGERAARRVEQVLSRYFREHQAGPFVFESEIHRTCIGIDALGYNFRFDDLDGCSRIDLTDAHAQRIIHLVDRAIEQDRAVGLTEPASSLNVLLGMRSGFRAAWTIDAKFELGLEYAREELTV